MTRLRPPTTATPCPYHGTATYGSCEVNGIYRRDPVWIDPGRKKIAGLACFYNEKVDLKMDGVLRDRPRTPFS